MTAQKVTDEEPDTVTLSGNDADLAEQMLKRVAAKQVEQIIAERANAIAQHVERIPNPSQLAQLRTVTHSSVASLKTVDKFQEFVKAVRLHISSSSASA